MANPRHVMVRTLITSSSPKLERQRRNDLEKIVSPIKRFGTLMLHEAVLAYPEMAARYTGIDLKAVRNSTWIGMGYDSVVAKISDTEVAKIHLNTLCMDRPHQQQFAEQKATEHSKLAVFMGKFCLPQSVKVDYFPGSTNQEAVLTRQPYRTLTNLGIFAPGVAMLNNTASDALRSLRDSHPDAASQLPDLVDSSLTLYEKTGLLPDVTGLDNVSVDAASGGIVLIDAYPLAKSSQELMRITLAQLHQLGDILCKAE